MIFLSYASEDIQRATAVYHSLKTAGFLPWMDKMDLLPGQAWEPMIWQAAARADFFCVLFSSRSATKRGFVRKEMRFALDKWKEKLPEDVYLIPCRLEPIPIPFEFQHIQFLDLFEDRDINPLTNLLASITTEADTQRSFQKKTISVKRPGLIVDIEYPFFFAPDLTELNKTLKQRAESCGDDVLATDVPQPNDPDHDSDTEYFFVSRFETYLASTRLLSVSFLDSHYFGGAHPNYGHTTFNFDRAGRRLLKITDVFIRRPLALHAVAAACRHDLNRQRVLEWDGPLDFDPKLETDMIRDIERDDNWICEGTGADWNNFSAFVIRDTSLDFLFSPYSVGCYAWGTRTVSLDWLSLSGYLNGDFITMLGRDFSA